MKTNIKTEYKVTSARLSEVVGVAISDAGFARLANAIRADLGRLDAEATGTRYSGGKTDKSGMYNARRTDSYKLVGTPTRPLQARALLLAIARADREAQADGDGITAKVTVTASPALVAWLRDKFGTVEVATVQASAPALVVA